MKVIFKKQIHGSMSSSSSTDIWLSHVMEMPFVPPERMEVGDGDWCDTVESLCYIDGQLFAFTAANMELYGRPGTRAIGKIAEEYVRSGWTISKHCLGE